MPPPFYLAELILPLIVFGAMLVEARRAAANERVQRARGGREPSGDVYAIMRIAYPGAFLAMFAETAGRPAPPTPVVLAGAAVFLAAKALKWWAIHSLGRAWTFRVIVLPGGRLVSRGPYRWLRHPNYIGVMGELAAVAVMTGARWTGVAGVVTFGILILKRIAVEERALRQPAR